MDAHHIVYAQLFVTVKVRAYAAAERARMTKAEVVFIASFEGLVYD